MDDNEVEKWLGDSTKTILLQHLGSRGLVERMELAADLLGGIQQRPIVQSLVFKSVGSKVAAIALKGTMVFGRSEEADFTLDNKIISRRHFEIVCEGDAAFLRDLDSVNGLKINGKDMKEKWLVDGDMIEVQPYCFMFINPLED